MLNKMWGFHTVKTISHPNNQSFRPCSGLEIWFSLKDLLLHARFWSKGVLYVWGGSDDIRLNGSGAWVSSGVSPGLIPMSKKIHSDFPLAFLWIFPPVRTFLHLFALEFGLGLGFELHFSNRIRKTDKLGKSWGGVQKNHHPKNFITTAKLEGYNQHTKETPEVPDS